MPRKRGPSRDAKKNDLRGTLAEMMFGKKRSRDDDQPESDGERSPPKRPAPKASTPAHQREKRPASSATASSSRGCSREAPVDVHQQAEKADDARASGESAHPAAKVPRKPTASNGSAKAAGDPPVAGGAAAALPGRPARARKKAAAPPDAAPADPPPAAAAAAPARGRHKAGDSDGNPTAAATSSSSSGGGGGAEASMLSSPRPSSSKRTAPTATTAAQAHAAGVAALFAGAMGGASSPAHSPAPAGKPVAPIFLLGGAAAPARKGSSAARKAGGKGAGLNPSRNQALVVEVAGEDDDVVEVPLNNTSRGLELSAGAVPVRHGIEVTQENCSSMFRKDYKQLRRSRLEQLATPDPRAEEDGIAWEDPRHSAAAHADFVEPAGATASDFAALRLAYSSVSSLASRHPPKANDAKQPALPLVPKQPPTPSDRMLLPTSCVSAGDVLSVPLFPSSPPLTAAAGPGHPGLGAARPLKAKAGAQKCEAFASPVLMLPDSLSLHPAAVPLAQSACVLVPSEVHDPDDSSDNDDGCTLPLRFSARFSTQKQQHDTATPPSTPVAAAPAAAAGRQRSSAGSAQPAPPPPSPAELLASVTLRLSAAGESIEHIIDTAQLAAGRSWLPPRSTTATGAAPTHGDPRAVVNALCRRVLGSLLLKKHGVPAAAAAPFPRAKLPWSALYAPACSAEVAAPCPFLTVQPPVRSLRGWLVAWHQKLSGGSGGRGREDCATAAISAAVLGACVAACALSMVTGAGRLLQRVGRAHIARKQGAWLSTAKGPHFAGRRRGRKPLPAAVAARRAKMDAAAAEFARLSYAQPQLQQQQQQQDSDTAGSQGEDDTSSGDESSSSGGDPVETSGSESDSATGSETWCTFDPRTPSKKQQRPPASAPPFGTKPDGSCAHGVVITGPPGVGKSAAVYAVAQELGYRVLEVNSSRRRTKDNLFAILGEATQCRFFANAPPAPDAVPGAAPPAKAKKQPKPEPPASKTAAVARMFGGGGVPDARKQAGAAAKLRKVGGRGAGGASPPPAAAAAAALLFGGAAAPPKKQRKLLAHGDDPHPEEQPSAQLQEQEQEQGNRLAGTSASPPSLARAWGLSGASVNQRVDGPVPPAVTTQPAAPGGGLPAEAGGRGGETHILVLIENADVFFEDEREFHQTIRALVAGSRCPVVLTARSPIPALKDTCVVLPFEAHSSARIAEHLATISPPPSTEPPSWPGTPAGPHAFPFVGLGTGVILQLILLTEGYKLPSHLLHALLLTFGPDLRAALNACQAWLQHDGLPELASTTESVALPGEEEIGLKRKRLQETVGLAVESVPPALVAAVSMGVPPSGCRSLADYVEGFATRRGATAIQGSTAWSNSSPAHGFEMVADNYIRFVNCSEEVEALRLPVPAWVSLGLKEPFSDSEGDDDEDEEEEEDPPRAAQAAPPPGSFKAEQRQDSLTDADEHEFLRTNDSAPEVPQRQPVSLFPSVPASEQQVQRQPETGASAAKPNPEASPPLHAGKAPGGKPFPKTPVISSQGSEVLFPPAAETALNTRTNSARDTADGSYVNGKGQAIGADALNQANDAKASSKKLADQQQQQQQQEQPRLQDHQFVSTPGLPLFDSPSVSHDATPPSLAAPGGPSDDEDASTPVVGALADHLQLRRQARSGKSRPKEAPSSWTEKRAAPHHGTAPKFNFDAAWRAFLEPKREWAAQPGGKFASDKETLRRVARVTACASLCDVWGKRGGGVDEDAVMTTPQVLRWLPNSLAAISVRYLAGTNGALPGSTIADTLRDPMPAPHKEAYTLSFSRSAAIAIPSSTLPDAPSRLVLRTKLRRLVMAPSRDETKSKKQMLNRLQWSVPPACLVAYTATLAFLYKRCNSPADTRSRIANKTKARLQGALSRAEWKELLAHAASHWAYC
ncbi:hypothetical protein DIPPA_14568 [Diplonema papillatum]|nr:hypothetical protein DIPPA_14568 [Diplonema papillatum]